MGKSGCRMYLPDSDEWNVSFEHMYSSLQGGILLKIPQRIIETNIFRGQIIPFVHRKCLHALKFQDKQFSE
jgi:hypothetical protein